MKVLFINETCGRGSHGRICTDLLDILHSQGDEGMVVYGRSDVPEEYAPYALRVGTKLDTYLHVIGTRIFDNTGEYSRNATRKIVQQIRQYDPDIIHLHNIHGYYIHVGALFDYLSQSNKPVIWTLHDSWGYTGHCTCSDYVGCDRWKNGCFHCPQKKNYPASYLFDGSKINYQLKKKWFTSVKDIHLVTPSEWLKSEVQQSFLGCYDVTVIRSGIDLEVFQPTSNTFRQKHQLDDKIILLSVANAWSQRKGLDIIRKLELQLDDRYQIVVVGGLHGQSLPDGVIHIEHTTSRRELAEIYSAADVYMNLSYEETQGLTTIEALACGTPAIVSNRTAIPESVDANCGIVVDPERIQELVEAIDRALLLKPENCIRHAAEYEKRKCFMRYIALYKEIVK